MSSDAMGAENHLCARTRRKVQKRSKLVEVARMLEAVGFLEQHDAFPHIDNRGGELEEALESIPSEIRRHGLTGGKEGVKEEFRVYLEDPQIHKARHRSSERLDDRRTLPGLVDA